MTSPTLSAFSNELAAAIAKTAPAIVGLQAKRLSASGVYWRSGVIVTTVDAVRRRDEVELVTENGTTIAAEVRGQDPGTDIAVLQADIELSTPEFGPSATLQPGHLVLAVGRDDGTVRASSGILASVGGPWQSWTGGHIHQLIRPDIVPFPGFPGSPLLDVDGRILGINTTYARGRFAITIPTTTVEQVVTQLLEQGRIAQGYLGIGLQPVEVMARLQQSLSLTQETAILIVSLEANGPADEAGVLVGDILLTLGGEAVTSLSQLRSQLRPERVGQSLTAQLIRGGQLIELSVVVGERR